PEGGERGEFSPYAPGGCRQEPGCGQSPADRAAQARADGVTLSSMHSGRLIRTLIASLAVSAIWSAAAAVASGRALAMRAAIDSVTVRAMFRWEGSNMEPCRLPEDWGWDSLTS